MNKSSKEFIKVMKQIFEYLKSQKKEKDSFENQRWADTLVQQDPKFLTVLDLMNNLLLKRIHKRMASPPSEAKFRYLDEVNPFTMAIRLEKV